MDENKANTPDTAGQAQQEPEQQITGEKTFTRDDVNRMIAAEKKKASEAARQEAMQEYQRQQEAAEQRRAESEKFARLQSEEQVKVLQERIASMEKERAEIQIQHEADQLKRVALEKAAQVKLPLCFVSDLDYRRINAEALDSLINDRLNAFNAAVEERLNGILPNRSPTTSKTRPDPDAWQPGPKAAPRNPWERHTKR